jgi:hypothetical protein
MGEFERREEIEKERLERIRNLGKIDTEELKERLEKLREDYRLCTIKLREDIKALEWAIKVKKVIGIYEKKGFEGVYAYALTEKSCHRDPEEGGRYTEDDFPF